MPFADLLGARQEQEVRRGYSQHERLSHGDTDEWLTPPEIVQALGPFDLDPCSPKRRPWATAAKHYTIDDNGLYQPWAGRVWLNPPYGPRLGAWLARMADHGDGIALVFARTETVAFHRFVWGKAAAMRFLRGRLRFYSVTGEQAPAGAGAPSVLIAYGAENAARLRAYEGGAFVLLRGSL